MEGLTKRIRDDWYDIHEVLDDVHLLEDVFGYSQQEMAAMSEGLRFSVEGGITEYKTSLLSSLYAYLDSLNYDSKGFDSLMTRGKELSRLTYVSLLQRLIASGGIKIKDSQKISLDEAAKETDGGVKRIMADIQQRIKDDPDMRQNLAVKNVLMQMSIYRRELDNMQKMAKKIPPEKKAAVLANFKKTFADITAKINEQYRELERADEKEAARDIPSTHPLKRVDHKRLASLFAQQAEEFSAISSTLKFAGAERYKTRDILRSVTDRQERTLLLVSTEQSQYAALEAEAEAAAGGGRNTEGLGISKAYSAEVIRVLSRQAGRKI